MYWQRLRLRAPPLNLSGGAFLSRVRQRLYGKSEMVRMEQYLSTTGQKRNRKAVDDIGSASDDSRGTHVRIATVDDLASIVSCLALAFGAASDDIVADCDDAQLADDLTSQISDGAIHVVCDQSHVLGYISFWPAADQMFVDTLAILPEHHRRGLGSQLLAYADFETRRLGYSAITLFTKAHMMGNLQFYKSRGYRETGRCDDDGYCRVFYVKKFPPVLAATVVAPAIFNRAPGTV